MRYLPVPATDPNFKQLVNILAPYPFDDRRKWTECSRDETSSTGLSHHNSAWRLISVAISSRFLASLLVHVAQTVHPKFVISGGLLLLQAILINTVYRCRIFRPE